MDCGKNRLYSLKNDLRIAITVSEIPYWWSYNKNLVDIKLRVDTLAGFEGLKERVVDLNQ